MAHRDDTRPDSGAATTDDGLAASRGTAAPREAPFLRSSALLAELQMTVNAAGLRLFDANLDRFVIATLLGRETIFSKVELRPIPVHALATSLGRSPETVRRHIDALVEADFCERLRGGVVAKPSVMQEPRVAAMLVLVHDSFVRFVDAWRSCAALPPTSPASQPYDWRVGLRTAIDIMLATLDANSATHDSWLDLVIFSAVLCANARRYDELGGPLDARHAIPVSVVARALGLPEATVRRRANGKDGFHPAIARTSKGLVLRESWLRAPGHRDVALRTQSNIRRLLVRAGQDGFPFDTLERAYLEGRPPPSPFI